MRVITKPVLVALVAGLLGVTVHAYPPRRSFIESWQGKQVEVKRTLITLVYNERDRQGTVRRTRRAGLTVASPLANPYFQFGSHDGGADIVTSDPQQVLDLLAMSTQRDEPAGAGSSWIEPKMMVRYERGGTLVVKSVHIERNRVRLAFDSVDEGPSSARGATELTIQWPTDLSPTLVEAPIIDALIRQFVDLPESR